MKIAIAGTGYVGLANAMLLAQHHEVVALDINEEKVLSRNARRSPIIDADIQQFLDKKSLNFRATLDKNDADQNADFVIVATPTDYDSICNYLDTSGIEDIVVDWQLQQGVRAGFYKDHETSLSKKAMCDHMGYKLETCLRPEPVLLWQSD